MRLIDAQTTCKSKRKEWIWLSDGQQKLRPTVTLEDISFKMMCQSYLFQVIFIDDDDLSSLEHPNLRSARVRLLFPDDCCEPTSMGEPHVTSLQPFFLACQLFLRSSLWTKTILHQKRVLAWKSSTNQKLSPLSFRTKNGLLILKRKQAI